jgi:O-antigen/teichoic acid export membrane protein
MQLIKFNTNLNLYYLTNLVNIFFSFATIALLSNFLTPKDFGFFSFVQNIFFILYSISFSNYYYELINQLSKKQKNKFELISIFFYTYLSVAIFIFILLIIFLVIIDFDKKVPIIALNLQLILLPFTILYYDLFVEKKFRQLFFIAIIGNIINLLIKFFLIKNNFEIYWICLSFSLDVIINSILINFSYKIFNNKKFNINFNLKKIKNLFQKLLFFPLLGILTIASYRIDIIMVNYLTNYENTAIYSIASRITLAISSFYFILIRFLYPLMSKNIADTNYIEKILKKVVGITIIFTTIIFIFFSIFGDYLLLIFGIFYLKSKSILLTLIINLMLLIILELSINYKYIKNNYFEIFKISMFYVFLNLILNYFFIKNYGFHSAAIATVISGLVTIIFFHMKEINYKNISFYFLLSNWDDIRKTVIKNVLKKK